MERDYQPLPIHELGTGAGFHRPTQSQAARVGLESPAPLVMTDLTRVSPATIRPQAPLAGANQFMITRGVRKPDTDLVTSRMLGCFRDDPQLRREFLGETA